MAESRNRIFSKLAKDINVSGEVITTGIASTVETGSAVTVYDSIGELPYTNNDSGDEAFVKSTGRYYLWTGPSWRSVALINRSPSISSVTFDSNWFDIGSNKQWDSAFTTATITITAADSDDYQLTYGIAANSTFDSYATISFSENVGTLTLNDSNEDVVISDLQFTATDGINIATFSSPYSIVPSNIAPSYGTISAGDASTSGNLIYRSSTSSTTITVSTENITAYVGLIGGGGAGGGWYYGGGGGAGELLVTGEVILTPGTYTFACGTGGTAPANTQGALGGNGGQSSITMTSGASIASSSTTINAYGGGRGGIDYSPNQNTDGADGGSGAGGGGNGGNAANGQAGGDAVKHTYSNWTSYASAGGPGTGFLYQGGGGGGATQAGSNTGDGGDGLDLRTIDSDLGTEWNTVRSTYYIGGGGGGGNYRAGVGENNGGAGGGGQGDGGQSSGWDATAGEFGGGGGGGGHTGNSGADDAGEGGGVGAFFIYIVNGTIS